MGSSSSSFYSSHFHLSPSGGYFAPCVQCSLQWLHVRLRMMLLVMEWAHSEGPASSKTAHSQRKQPSNLAVPIPIAAGRGTSAAAATMVDATMRKPAGVGTHAIPIRIVALRETSASAAIMADATTKTSAGAVSLRYPLLTVTARAWTEAPARIRWS